MSAPAHRVDALDARILLALDEDPSASVLALAHRVGSSRNTVHARLQRMNRQGLLLGFTQRVSPAVLGYGLVAFVSLAISQAESTEAIQGVQMIPEVVEVHKTTGDADFLVKVVARDTADLNRVMDTLVSVPGVVRSSTAVSLEETMPYRTRALLERLATMGGEA
ncbi:MULTISPECIES: Lrp/AsnC family transcriptional regulator [Arthrobacter]|uniref:Lrp/AsnC family transcriptional regulator n=2 Tax=Arthrobacter TaxID=1663 RepID=A0ABU9KFX9_9MICC|nr:Lrp/AsnC family transcriptional regulator [Arthrobacter sp. YJM1]MDP5225785.1 Lrp/AsnC family transcriptional regulator [Arthrobacter sp. YJM1]